MLRDILVCIRYNEAEVKNLHELSVRLKKLRLEKEMTQDQLAQKTHVTRQAISNWETGKTQPDLEMLKTLADIYDVTLSELVGESQKSHNNKRRWGAVAMLTTLTLVLFAVSSFVYKVSVQRMIQRYEIQPQLLFYVGILKPLCYACGTAALLMLLTIPLKIEVNSNWVKRFFLVLGTAITLYFAILPLVVSYEAISQYPLIISSWMLIFIMPQIAAVPTTLLFFGVYRTNK